MQQAVNIPHAVTSIFEESFIQQCLSRVTAYNASSQRKLGHTFFLLLSHARRIPELEQQLRTTQTATDCFALLLFLVKRERHVAATGFSAMSMQLRESLCQELKTKRKDIFTELVQLTQEKLPKNVRSTDHPQATGFFFGAKNEIESVSRMIAVMAEPVYKS